MNPLCGRCNQVVYPTEKVNCLDKVYICPQARLCRASRYPTLVWARNDKHTTLHQTGRIYSLVSTLLISPRSFLRWGNFHSVSKRYSTLTPTEHVCFRVLNSYQVARIVSFSPANLKLGIIRREGSFRFTQNTLLISDEVVIASVLPTVTAEVSHWQCWHS
ncbi:hypothetical protein GOODEAATRI_025901 [Goodea atripinnis]|uniref:Uncharacterized protein n=1 Tax=Goodea atripinnis TaxID=208336 RepID=A0ABV0PH29_9TELE